MKGGYYRPMYFHTLKAGLDADGNVAGWQHRIVGQSILAGTPFESMMVKDGIDRTSVEGASNLPYAIPNMPVELHSPKLGVPVLWWRSVGSTHTAYLDRDVHRRARRRRGQGSGRVPPRAAREASAPPRRARARRGEGGLGHAAGAGKAGEKRGRGVAVHESFNTFVAQVAEVTVDADNKFTVDRVVCAVDCGVAVNPDVVRAQMEGGIGFGLSAALHGAITLKDGVVEQSNFHDYPLLRINEMPAVEVHIVPSTDKPTGVGEPGVPLIAPAVANALAAATGQAPAQAAAVARVRRGGTRAGAESRDRRAVDRGVRRGRGDARHRPDAAGARARLRRGHRHAPPAS